MSAIKKIIKEARVRPDSNIHNEICSSLNNTEVLLQLGFEELDYCLKNHFISMRDLSYIFSKGDRASKLMVMDLGFNPSREGLDYAKKNNDFDMANRIFLMGISATEEDLSWAIDNNKTEFYKFFKDLNPAVFIDELMSEKKYEEVAKLVKEKGEFPKSVLDYKNCKEVLKLLDEDLWSSTVDEIMEDLISKKDISSLKLMVEKLPTISSGHLESIAELGNIELFKLALECSSEVTLGVLGCAAYSGNVDVFKLALEYNSEVDEWVLESAAKSGNIDILKLALERNPNPSKEIIKYIKENYNFEIPESTPVKKSESTEITQNKKDNNGNAFLNPFDNFDETEEQNQNPVKKTHTTNNKNVAKSLFPDVSPLLQGAVNQIIFEDGKGLYTFLKTVKDMGIEYSLEDIIDISKNGEVKDKLNASLSSEMSEQVVNSRLFNIAFRILETPKSISAFLNKNQNIDIYQKANALFQKLMSENRDSGISKDRIIKIIEKRAKDFDLIRLCEDLERLAKFSYYKNDDE